MARTWPRFDLPPRLPSTRIKDQVRPIERFFTEGLDTIDEDIEVVLKMASAIVVQNAKRILKEEIYDADRGEHAAILTGRLIGSFRREPVHIAGRIGSQNVANTAPEAYWLEHGTSSHYIPVGEKGFLAWQGPEGWAYSKGHNVSGVKAMHFMERAMLESEADVISLFYVLVESLNLDTKKFELALTAKFASKTNGDEIPYNVESISVGGK